MTGEHLEVFADEPRSILFEHVAIRTLAGVERELAGQGTLLIESLAREAALAVQAKELAEQHEVLRTECDHRLANNLQMITSLLLMQSRAAANTETASQLIAAANRVATIGRIHRRLHSFEGAETVDFKQYLQDFCSDFAPILCPSDRIEHVIVVEAIECRLATATGIPLAFIINELVTNAVKYGQGQITLRLEVVPGGGYSLSVRDEGLGLPEIADQPRGTGLGMKIVRSLIDRIGGELRVGRGAQDQGSVYSVLFS